jgi:hypothetical protein
MLSVLLILGALRMKQSESPLALEAALSARKGELFVIARLSNRGKKKVSVVLDDYFCQIETRLYTDKGVLLEPWDRRAVTCHPQPPEQVKPNVLDPGAVVEVMTFSIVVDHSNAMAGPLSWEVQEFAGQTLQVEFTYAVREEVLEKVGKLGASGVAVGSWTSPKVDVPTKKLNQKQVENILSGRRMIRDARAVPLLVRALAGEKDEVIREHAAESLGEIKAMGAALALSKLLGNDPARGVRICAARALAEIASPESREALTKAAQDDSDSLVRTLSEDALKKLRP